MQLIMVQTTQVHGHLQVTQILVDSKCPTGGAGKCDDVTLNITTTGDDNAYTVYVGETTTADNMVANFVTGDLNVITTDVDGTPVAVTLVMNNDQQDTNSTDNDEGNAVVITMDGNGDSNGHTVNLDITGGGPNL